MAVRPDPDLPIRPLTVRDVSAMVEAGILGPEDRCELIDGVLVEKMTQGEPHVFAVAKLNKAVMPTAVAARLEVLVQSPTDVRSDLSLPEPDLAVVPMLSPRRHAGDAVLVVEVSVSSLRADLGRKARLYAMAGIPEYWVLDVEGRALHRHTHPEDGVYSSVVVHDAGMPVSASAFDLTVEIDSLLG